MPNAPRWFLDELRAFDSDLRLRWSFRLQNWQLERKVTRSLHPGTIRNDSWHDDYIRAQEGYILVATIPFNGLSRSVFERLRASDLWSNGGWQRVAEELEELERVQEEKVWNDFQDSVRASSAELYNLWKIRDGRTVFNAGWVA
jgi:hypothetical protein